MIWAHPAVFLSLSLLLDLNFDVKPTKYYLCMGFQSIQQYLDSIKSQKTDLYVAAALNWKLTEK